jgi:hypothetical protein
MEPAIEHFPLPENRRYVPILTKEEAQMRKSLVAFAFLTAFCIPAFAQNHGGNHYHGAPGPVAGAGLPILAVGYGVYWLLRRRRNAK